MKVAIEMTDLMQKGKHIIYVDESSFHRWLVPMRTYVAPSMTLKMPSSRGHSISVIAAISSRKGLVHYKIVNGSNHKDTFAEFVYGLVKAVRGEAVVYMDNFSVHYSKKVKEFFNERVT